MCGDGAGELGGGEVALAPQVADGVGLGHIGNEGLHIDLLVLFAYVEDVNGGAAVGERTRPDFDVALFQGAVGLLAEYVLIDEVNLVVAKQSDGEVVHLGYVAALQYMTEGDDWMVYIPNRLAYGETDHGVIPAYSTLQFRIHMAAIYPCNTGVPTWKARRHPGMP